MAARKKSKKVKKVAKSKRTTNAKAKAKSAKPTAKKQTSTKLTAKKKKSASQRKQPRRRSGQEADRVYTHREGVTFEPEAAGLRRGGQSGDLQGLPDREDADSESVEELIEEGNAFEAEAVAGVEHVEDDEEREVHTHEVPEDDVPGEYQDKD
jgi:hypothetical protein